MSCSESNSPEDEDEDEDSDRILGLWLVETLAPSENPNPAQTAQSTEENQEGNVKTTNRTGSIVPEKGEPHGVIFGYTCFMQYNVIPIPYTIFL